MFVYATCAGPSDKFATVLSPSLERLGFGPMLVRRDAPSIFEAYNDMVSEAVTRWPDLEGVVLTHDDVAIRDSEFETVLRATFADPNVGVVGVIGGRGHVEMAWWKSKFRFGCVGSPLKKESYLPGPAVVDTVDGLLMAVSPRFAREHRLNGRGYPPFHGYDSELCAVARAAGMTVMVADTDVFHDHKPVPIESPALSWAMFEWMLRWRPARPWIRATWRAKRLVLRCLTERGVATAPRLPWRRWG